jgi:hypothetical protein
MVKEDMEKEIVKAIVVSALVATVAYFGPARGF